MFDFYQSIYDEHDEQDEDAAYDYVHGLMAEFVESPEGNALLEVREHLGWAATMMEYATNHIGVSIPKMTTRDFNEVLFELFPQKVSVAAIKAGEIVAELRAFWSFVLRQYEARTARDILAILDDRATHRLQALLADPGNFGMAKSIVMMGIEAGFDMTSQAGMEQFMAAFNARLLGRPMDRPMQPHFMFEMPSPATHAGDALKQKRKDRKRQRVAKKRNRR